MHLQGLRSGAHDRAIRRSEARERFWPIFWRTFWRTLRRTWSLRAHNRTPPRKRSAQRGPRSGALGASRRQRACRRRVTHSCRPAQRRSSAVPGRSSRCARWRHSSASLPVASQPRCRAPRRPRWPTSRSVPGTPDRAGTRGGPGQKGGYTQPHPLLPRHPDVRSATVLSTGLLPLTAVLDDLWDRLRRLAPEIGPARFAELHRAIETGKVDALNYKARVDIGAKDDGRTGPSARTAARPRDLPLVAVSPDPRDRREHHLRRAQRAADRPRASIPSGPRHHLSSSSLLRPTTSTRRSRRPAGTSRLRSAATPSALTRTGTSAAAAPPCRRTTSSSSTSSSRLARSLRGFRRPGIFYGSCRVFPDFAPFSLALRHTAGLVSPFRLFPRTGV